MNDGKIEVLKGIKIEPEEAAKLDPAKMGVGLAAPNVPDVEGQALIRVYVRCPWCGSVRRVIVDTNRWTWYTCGNCGGPYRV